MKEAGTAMVEGTRYTLKAILVSAATAAFVSCGVGACVGSDGSGGEREAAVCFQRCASRASRAHCAFSRLLSVSLIRFRTCASHFASYC